MMDNNRYRIEIKDPVVVAMGPAGEIGPETWGFYQFPDMWRASGGEIYLTVHVGADSQAGRHEPAQFFVSLNEGRSWLSVDEGKADMLPEIIGLSDGKQISFGKQKFLYHNCNFNFIKNISLLTDELGMEPVSGPFIDGYGVNEYVCYQYSDIPEGFRSIDVSIKQAPNGIWERTHSILDMPDLLIPSLVRAAWWDEKGMLLWEEIRPRLKLPVPDRVVVLDDGTMLWALACQHPAVDKLYSRVVCLESNDYGRTWKARGMIADDTERTSWGYGFGEQSIAHMPNGELLCAMRTKTHNDMNHTHYLAMARSSDKGYTWTVPEPAADFCVTPHLLTLKNGLVTLIYGRPGVHVRVSADSGYTWSNSIPIVGPSEAELLKRPKVEWWNERHDYSCSNTDIVIIGPDKFLIAYSDFKHSDEGGNVRKAVKVREIIANML